jgi:hypothetical protein
MKKKLFFLTVVISLLFSNVFSQTVYITKTGAKYHTSTCRYLSKSSYAINLSDAISKGYDACKVCKPSSIETTTHLSNQTLKKTQEEEVRIDNNSANKVIQSAQCAATTKKGNRCKRSTKSPNGYCWQHGGN